MQKRGRTRLLRIVWLVSALLLVLGAVLLQQHRAAVQAAQAEEARLARAAALRERYPYISAPPAGMMAPLRMVYPEEDSWLRHAQTVALVEVSGDWENYSFYSSPTGKPGDGMGTGITYYHIPIEIEKVLYREEGMEVSEGSAWATVSSYAFWGKDRIQKGDRLILMGGKSRSGDYYKDQPLLTLSWIVSYYLSEDGTVMSMDDDPLVDALSGMQYEDFVPRILEIAEHSHALKQEKEEEA